MQCTTPIVFVVFNRPEQTRRVFERIASVRPARLLVIADGPRASRPEEAQVCAEVREIATQVDWPCELLTNFAQENLGCRKRLATGLKWAFEQAERAIILEDDILADASFFHFCDEMLERYADDTRVAMIAGTNFVRQPLSRGESYYFSRMTHIWGWATWRRAWRAYDEHLIHWPEIKASGLMKEIVSDRRHRAFWTHIFDQMHSGTGPNTWDYQWAYTNFIQGSLAIVPKVNLVENLGFGPLATHTTQAADAPYLPVQALEFPLVHPLAEVALQSMDWLDMEASGCRLPSGPRRVAGRLKRAVLGRSKA